ncbi:hypothetical protein HDU92_003989 [Lobulomyces angularis]|nr:hypothetical protein HDU92_003989 [Lobulomyces angularis]
MSRAMLNVKKRGEEIELNSMAMKDCPILPILQLNNQQQILSHDQNSNFIEKDAIQIQYPITKNQHEKITFLSNIPLTCRDNKIEASDNVNTEPTDGEADRYSNENDNSSGRVVNKHQVSKQRLDGVIFDNSYSKNINIKLLLESSSTNVISPIRNRFSVTNKMNADFSTPLQQPENLGKMTSKTNFFVLQGSKVFNSPLVECNRQPQDSLYSNDSTFSLMTVEKKNTVIVFITGSSGNPGTPFSMFSLIPFSDVKKVSKKKKVKSNQPKTFAMLQIEKLGSTLPESLKKRKAESFAHFLQPSNFLQQCNEVQYNPYFVDDPELKMGKNKTVLTLPCFMSSIISYSKPLDLKKELDDLFKETHPNVDSTLTLSQIRSLKVDMLDIGKKSDTEFSSIAFAYVYFEKLALKTLVSQSNRKLIGAICLFLASKVNDPKDKKYNLLLENIEKTLDITSKEIFSNEFFVYSALEFTLFLPTWEVLPHLNRIVEGEGTTVDDYLSHSTFWNGSC